MFLVSVFFLIGTSLIITPWVPGLLPGLSVGARLVMTVVGSFVVILCAFATMIARFYRKASANMAFVRTGGGGVKIIRDKGSIVFPLIHHITPVSLETMRLNVERRGPHALITRDNLRVDLSAEFYIKVEPNTDHILQAARSLGGRNVQPDAVSELVQEKLVSALRTVAATKELVELHAKRDEFAAAVQEIVTHDLASNGLTLESVTISSLDQTDPSQLQDKNVFDAQGLRKIAEITQRARVERNIVEREAERQVVEKNVATTKKVLDLQRDQAEFEAEQKMKVANVRAAREREVQEFKIAQDEAISRRDIEKMKNIETTEVERTLAVEQAQVAKKVALVVKQREQETAESLKKQTVEVAERSKEVAVAEKERERAEAQAAVLAAEAEREAARQKVLTVQVASEADREAGKQLIAAKQVIEQNKLREQTSADVAAYMAVKKAEAERQAAEAQYQAKLRLAEGDAQAATKQAEGQRAVKMVDVTIGREQVGVEQARVEVERQSLSNKQEFEGAALQFELEKLRIAAERDVRIAAAQAMGNMLAKAQMQIFGDPTTMAAMAQQFLSAAGLGVAAEGLMKTLPPQGQELLSKVAGAVASQLQPRGESGNGASVGLAAPVEVPPVVKADRK